MGNDENMKKEEIQIGKRVLVEQAWEDEAGYLHDESADIVGINENGSLQLKFDSKEVNDFLESAEFFPEDVSE